MMLDAITFDLGSVRSPAFVFPDVSGLGPLSLPDEFLRGRDQQQPEPQSDTVRRFETAMSARQPFSPSVVESVLARMISESPKTESQKVESQNPAVASVVDPVPIASVERPMVVTANTVVLEEPVVHTAGETPIVAPDLTKAPVIAAPAEPMVVIETASIQSADRPKTATVEIPKVVTVERPVVASFEKSVVERVDRPTVATVEVPTLATVEKPVSVAPSPAPIVIPVIVENPDNRVKAEGISIVESNVPIAPETKPVARIETPVADVTTVVAPDRDNAPVIAPTPVIAAPAEPTVVIENESVQPAERPRPATVEIPTLATVEKPVPVAPSPAPTVVPVVVENPDNRVRAEGIPVVDRSIPIAPETKPVARIETPVTVDKTVVAPDQTSAPMIAAPVEPTVVIETASVQPADRPRTATVEIPKVVTVERPVVASIEKPVVERVDQPTVATIEAPMVATVERPMVVASSPAPTVAPVVVENPDKGVKVEGHPAVESNVSIVPATKPISRLETPVAVDKTAVAPDQTSAPVIAAPVEPMVVSETAFVQSTERPRPATVQIPKVVTVEQLVVASVETPAVERVDRPTVATVEIPTLATVEKPVPVAPSSTPTVVPVVVADPDNRVKAEGHPFAESNAPILPAAKPVSKAETPVAVDKPLGVSAERSVNVAVERPAVAAVNPMIHEGAARPTVATVDEPEEMAVAASAHVVVAPPIEVPVPQAVQTAPEVAAVAAASARTEAIVETVNQIVEAVVGQILVTPGITHGECEIKIMLKPTVLDGSEVTMSAKDGTLTVSITPSTQEASAAATAALPRLEIALAEHAPAFHHVSVALQLKKGNRNEAV